jgi:hypothetical protein
MISDHCDLRRSYELTNTGAMYETDRIDGVHFTVYLNIVMNMTETETW